MDALQYLVYAFFCLFALALKNKNTCNDGNKILILNFEQN
jgi:hypothetical protein